jgi:hypothetical protein
MNPMTVDIPPQASRGIWRDRDPDQFLAASRSGLDLRDEELKSARLDAR